MNEERELNWDDTIEKESDFLIVPEGDYSFTVESFERARHTPKDGGKLPACNKAVLSIRIDTPEGAAYITHSLFLHSRMEGRLSEFFTCIGQKKKGEPLRMNWNAVPGSTGRAHVTLDTDKNDPSKKFNHIGKFYPMEGKSFTKGQF